MKRFFIILIMLVITCGLWAEVKKDIFTGVLSINSGLFSGAKAGIGRVDIYDEYAMELSLNYKIDLEVTFKPQLKQPLHNIYLQRNRFYNPQRTKSFFILKGGVMWWEMFDWFGGTNSKNTIILPLAAIGYGYSYKINDLIFLRPSIDVGFQTNLINIELSCAF